MTGKGISTVRGMNKMTKRVTVRLVKEDDVSIPFYASSSAAGVDLSSSTDLVIEPGETALVPTGLWFAIPEGFEAQIRPRSGLALRNSVTVLNSPGTIDADYRGEVKVILINHGKKIFTVSRGDRIAQMVIAPVMQCDFVECDILPCTDRGENGFGSTGLNNNG